MLLAIKGWRAEWADYFMYVFSGKWIWVPLYAAILYVIVRNLHWKVAIGCVMAIALTIVFADQVGATVIRPVVCRLRPANLENPISEFVQIVNGYRGGRYGFPSCHAANTFGLAFFLFYLFRYWLFSRLCKYRRKESYEHIYVPIWVGGITISGILAYALVRAML